MSADYVRRTYGVDFKRGDRVLVDGRPGFIVSFPGQYLGVRFDGDARTSRCHPTWRVERAELLTCNGCGTTYDATDPDVAGRCVHDDLCKSCHAACDRGRSCRDGCHERGEGMSALPTPLEATPRPWCPDCGPGYRLGDHGCRHGSHRPAVGDRGICRTCAKPIWWETGEIGHREYLGWSDRILRGGDSLVCFKAVGYRHVPMGAREEAIWQAGYACGKDDA